MKVLICGIDGYLGFPLALHLLQKGHEVSGLDNGLRRDLVDSVGGQSIVPILGIDQRLGYASGTLGKILRFYECDMTEYSSVNNVLQEVKPDCIVHLAEMPSAPYSMQGVHQAAFTHNNNVIGTINLLFAMKQFCPEAHLLKLGTMGEWGTPNCDIQEGAFPDGSMWTYRGEHQDISGMMFPKKPGSFYHATKVHDSTNIEFACRNWKLRSTDVMQGVVYGTRIHAMYNNPKLATRFDVDECFGTVINRFVAQAVAGLPLTVYGKGGQKRGFLPLRDSIQCLTLAVENPPSRGQYRVFNQLEEVYSINHLAEVVHTVASDLFNLESLIHHVDNPRNEEEEHHYQPVHEKLTKLGYIPTNNLFKQVQEMFEDLLPHRDRIVEVQDALIPRTKWS